VYYILFLLIFFIHSANSEEFYLNADSQYCQEINELNSDVMCSETIDNKSSLLNELSPFEKILKITPKDSLNSIANILRLKYFEQFGKPLRRRLMLSNALGSNPRTFLNEFKSSYSKCSEYADEMSSIVEYASGGLTIFENESEQNEYKVALLKRYRIALIEVYRLNILQKQFLEKGLNPDKINSSLNQIYNEYPTIKTILTQNSKIPSTIVARLSVMLKSYDIHKSANITHQNINQILGFQDNTIDISNGDGNKKINFYRNAYHNIINDSNHVVDHWLSGILIKNDLKSTSDSVSFLGDICQMSPCEIVQSSPKELKNILSKTLEYSKYDVEKFMCNTCNFGVEKRTYSKTQVMLASLGAIGAGVGCFLTAPLCIPAVIASGGIAYMSYENYKDSKINAANSKEIAKTRSFIAESNEDFASSLHELERSQKEKTNAALLLLLDSTLVGGEVLHTVKLTKNVLSSFIKTNKTSKYLGQKVTLLRGAALNDIPTDALDVFLKVSRNPNYIPTVEELNLLKSKNLLDSFKNWTSTNQSVRALNEKMAIMYRSKIKNGDDTFILRFLKNTGKILFPMYKSFQFNNKVNPILKKILLDPNYKLSATETLYLTKKGHLAEVERFQADALLGLQGGFAKIEKVRDVSNKAVWGVTLGAAGANLFVDDYISLDDSFNESSDLGMSRYDGKVELIFTSPMPHVSIRIGGLVYNYGVMKVARHNLDEYRNSVGFGETISGNHIRIELNLNEDEKKKLIKYLEADVGMAYPLALPFVDCISQTNKAIKVATGIDVPVIMDRSQALSIGYYNILKLSGDERVGKVTFATNENPIIARGKESAVNILDSLMFTRYAPIMLPVTPVLDQYRLTIDPETKEFK